MAQPGCCTYDEDQYSLRYADYHPEDDIADERFDDITYEYPYYEDGDWPEYE